MAKNNNKCFECGDMTTFNHHVVPRSVGGKKTIKLCIKCHAKVHNINNCMDISQLTKNALLKKKKNKERISGKIPYGYDLAANGINLKNNLKEQKIIADIIKMKFAGISFPKIAKLLTQNHVKTKTGQYIWNQSTVRSIFIRSSSYIKCKGLCGKG